MKRQNKIILVVLLFIVLAFVLSGCVSLVNNQPYSVSGYVRDIQGNPISGVTISFSNGYSSVITNSQGYWSASGLTGNVIVTPLYSGYSFSPSSITVSSASSNVDFTAIPEYEVSGYVKDLSGNPLSGVTISFSNGFPSVTTNSEGYWSANGLSGSVIVTPLMSGWTFTPSQITVSSSNSQVNFTGTYSISGYIKDSYGNPISGVIVSFSGNYPSVKTNSNGYWSSNGFSGSIVVTPSMNGYTFNPPNITVTGPNNSVNFTGTQIPSYSYVNITITNNQSVATAQGFQQEITFNPQLFASYESWDLGNIRFYDSNGNPLYSWVESGNLSSTNAIIWVKLDQIILAGGNITIQMRFLNQGTEFDGVYAGEAPNLSSSYAQYDNGSNVFTNYQNFVSTNSTSFLNDWNSNSSYLPTINNGAFFNTNNSDQHLVSNWPTNSSFLYNEVYVLSQNTTNCCTLNIILGSSSLPQSWEYETNTDNIGYADGSGLEISSNYSYSPAIVAYANPNPQLPCIVGTYKNILYANYENVGTISGNILSGGYTAIDENSGAMGENSSLVIYWVRQRIAPPDNVMPTLSLSSVL